MLVTFAYATLPAPMQARW